MGDRDGADNDRPRFGSDRSAALRARLASVGIVIDDDPPAAAIPAARAPDAGPDREAIRAVLTAAGAPARDLEWLVASCPSVAHARGYTAPEHAAARECHTLIVTSET